jgi:hypothetical protein
MVILVKYRVRDEGRMDCSAYLTLPSRDMAGSCKIIGFEVLTAVSTKMAVFWVVAPCSLV